MLNARNLALIYSHQDEGLSRSSFHSHWVDYSCLVFAILSFSQVIKDSFSSLSSSISSTFSRYFCRYSFLSPTLALSHINFSFGCAVYFHKNFCCVHWVELNSSRTKSGWSKYSVGQKRALLLQDSALESRKIRLFHAYTCKSTELYT